MSTVVIRINGTDITDDVLIAGASFTSLVNGQVGPATLRVKDVNQTYDFTSGGSLTLDIDGDRIWGGYVMRALKTYPLVVGTLDPGSLTRVWSIAGADYNLLFNKRLIYKLDNPTGKIDWLYDASTYDDTIILDLFDNYLEIGGDGLSSAGVERIAHAILDVPGKVHRGLVASAGVTWKQAMDRVARATGGVYYISPEKVLYYVDVEDATSAYSLTDTPTTGSMVGFQSFELVHDGTGLVNDMFVWGTALGASQYVFSRVIDAASVALHGRRQLAMESGGLYRQASVDIVANSYVYGTPQSHRGGKNDAISLQARVFQPVFRAGQVVDVSVNIYDYNDALPIRRMVTTFVNPTEPIFDLLLGHEIDQPVGFWEQLPPTDIGDGGGDGGGEPPPPGDPNICYIFDDFNSRTIIPDELQGDWGYASSGPHWVWGGEGLQNGVGGDSFPGKGWFANDSVGGGHFTVETGLSDSDDLFIEMKMKQHPFSGTVFNFGSLEFGVLGPDTILPYNVPGGPGHAIFVNDGLGGYHETEFDFDDLDNPLSEFLPSMFILQAERVGGIARARIWNEFAAQPDWMVSGSIGSGGLGIEKVQLDARPNENGEGLVEIDYIKFCADCASGCNDSICGITDDFDRTVADGYPTDTSTSGYGWDVNHPGGWSVASGTLTMTTDTDSGNTGLVGTLAGGGATPSVMVTGQVIDSGSPHVYDIWFVGGETRGVGGGLIDFAEVDFSTDGTVVLYTLGGDDTTTVGFAPTSRFNVRLEANGSEARCKVWLAADSEPSAWLLTAAFDTPQSEFETDIYIGVGHDSGNDPMTATFQAVDADGINRCLTGTIDDYQNRTIIEDGWGDASNGNTWDIYGTDPTRLSVRNGYGEAVDGMYGLVGIGGLGNFTTGAVSLSVDLYVTLPGSGEYTLVQPQLLQLEESTYNGMQPSIRFNDDGSVELDISYQNSNGDTNSTALTAELSGPYNDRWLRFTVEIDATGARAVIWPRGQAQPTWQASTTADYAASLVADYGSGRGAFVGVNLVTYAGLTMRVDNWAVGYPRKPCYYVGVGEAGYLGAASFLNQDSNWMIYRYSGTNDVYGPGDQVLDITSTPSWEIEMRNFPNNFPYVPTPWEYESRVFVSHDAPVGATHAELTCRVRGDTGLSGLYAADHLWCIYQANYGGGTPSWNSITSLLASGSVHPNSTTGVIGDNDAISVDIPVVDGRVQFALTFDPLMVNVNSFNPPMTSRPRYPNFQNTWMETTDRMSTEVLTEVNTQKYMLVFKDGTPVYPATGGGGGSVAGRPCSDPPAASGRILETLAPATGLDIFTSHAFVAGTPRVWINGLIQDNFTTEPSAGKITLSEPVVPEDLIIVEYVASSAPVQPPPPPGYFEPAPAGVPVFSGDPTGVTDVSSALEAFLEDGGDLALEPGATYRCDNRIQLNSLDGWHLYGQGATIVGQGIYSYPLKDTILRMVLCNDFLIEDLYIVGEATLSDVINWTSWARENEHNFMIDGCTDATLRRCRGTGAWGDGVDIAARSSTENCDRVLIDNCYFSTSGRNNISITGARNVQILDCILTSAGLANFDAEPNNASDWNYQVEIRRTDFRLTDLGDTPSAAGSGYALYLSAGHHGASHYLVDGCTGDKLDIYLQAPSGYTNTDIIITHNSSDVLATLSVENTTGLTFAYNTNITSPSLGSNVVSFSGTADELQALTTDMSIDVIEFVAGTYSDWRACDITTNRTSRPLAIRPATGATVIFDAASDGDYGDSPFRISGGSYITFDGSPGAFVFQHYLLAQAGVFTLTDAHHITLNNITAHNIAGNSISNEQSSHLIYVSHSCHDLTFNNWTGYSLQAANESGGSYGVSGLHCYTAGTPNAIYNVTATGWTISDANWALVTRNATTGIIIDNWDVDDCGHGGVPATVDFDSSGCTGTVSNVTTTNSAGTALILGSMTNGGGNSWA